MSTAIRIDDNRGFCNPSEIEINQEYSNMLPRPSQKEYQQMKFSIKKDGQEKPITVDQQMVLIDGHSRLNICNELGITVYYEKKFFEDRNKILRFMAIVNLHRRNLNQYQKVILYKELYLEAKKRAYQRMMEGAKRGTDSRLGKVEELTLEEKGDYKIHLAREDYAKQIGVTQDAVYKSFFIAENAGKVVNKKVREGKITTQQAYWIAREKKGRKRTKEKTREYFFTIQSKGMSIWKTHRRIRPSQVVKIRDYIMRLDV
jgi:hypothetical protein